MKNFYVISTLLLCSSVAFAQSNGNEMYQPWGAKAAQQPQQNQQGNGQNQGQPNTGNYQGNGRMNGSGQMQGNGQMQANNGGMYNNGQGQNGYYGNNGQMQGNGQMPANNGGAYNGNGQGNGGSYSGQRQGQGQNQQQQQSTKGYAVNDEDNGSGQPADVYLSQKNNGKKSKPVPKSQKSGSNSSVVSGDLKDDSSDVTTTTTTTEKNDPRGPQVDFNKSSEARWTCTGVIKCSNNKEHEAYVFGHKCEVDFVDSKLTVTGLNDDGFAVEKTRVCLNNSSVTSVTINGETVYESNSNGNGNGGGGNGGPNGGGVAGGPNGGPGGVIVGNGGPTVLPMPTPVFVPVPVAPIYRRVGPVYCRPGYVGCNGGGYPPRVNPLYR